MARDVSVRLSADVQAYLSAMGQAEQATERVADAADRGAASVSVLIPPGMSVASTRRNAPPRVSLTLPTG